VPEGVAAVLLLLLAGSASYATPALLSLSGDTRLKLRDNQTLVLKPKLDLLIMMVKVAGDHQEHDGS
jgi:hypothetical protein